MNLYSLENSKFYALFSNTILVPYIPSFYYILSGGSAKGFVHVGILKYLEQIGIVPKGVIGTSMGSLIGALYACYMNTKDIESHIQAIVNSQSYFAFSDKYFTKNDSAFDVFTSKLKTSLYLTRALFSSFVSYPDMFDLFSFIFKDIAFSRLTIPYACVATDLINGESDILYKGNLCESIMASCSIPFIFPVIKLNHTLYTDGGALANLPIKQAHLFFDDSNGFYIGSDASSPIQKINNDEINNFDLAQRLMTLSIQSKMADERTACDFVFSPLNEYSRWSLFENYSNFINTGYEYAKANTDVLISKIINKIRQSIKQERNLFKRFNALSALNRFSSAL